MNSKRIAFFRAHYKLRTLLVEPLLLDTFPPSAAQNYNAQALRRGLVVTVFSSLELYIEECIQALLSASAIPTFPYKSLPDGLRKIVTVDALVGVSTRMGFMEKADKLPYAEREIGRLAGFGSVPLAYSSAGFSPKGSNLGHEDVKVLFQAYGVIDPWQRLNEIAAAIGAPRISLLDDFRKMASDRHQCAHNPLFILPTSDLANHLEACAAIAICVDMLAMKCATAIAASKNATTLAAGLVAPTPTCRFLDEDGSGLFLERPHLGGQLIAVM